MAITTLPAKILKETMDSLLPLDLKEGRFDELIDRMRKAMVVHHGIGLAANQISEHLSLFVIDRDLAQEQGVSDVFANPSITNASTEYEDLEEGCLSIPGYWTPIRRSKKIMFKALDGKGNKVKFRARGLLARVLQHETDHLNGTTIRDRARAQKKS
jgi:peptide deformylase